MKLFLLVLVLFLLAFAGLAIGLIIRNKGLRGGCGHAPAADHECRCEAELDKSMRGHSSQCKNRPTH